MADKTQDNLGNYEGELKMNIGNHNFMYCGICYAWGDKPFGFCKLCWIAHGKPKGMKE